MSLLSQLGGTSRVTQQVTGESKRTLLKVASWRHMGGEEGAVRGRGDETTYDRNTDRKVRLSDLMV